MEKEKKNCGTCITRIASDIPVLFCLKLEVCQHPFSVLYEISDSTRLEQFAQGRLKGGTVSLTKN